MGRMWIPATRKSVRAGRYSGGKLHLKRVEDGSLVSDAPAGSIYIELRGDDRGEKNTSFQVFEREQALEILEDLAEALGVDLGSGDELDAALRDIEMELRS